MLFNLLKQNLAEAHERHGRHEEKEMMKKRKAALIEAGISEEEVEESFASFDL